MDTKSNILIPISIADTRIAQLSFSAVKALQRGCRVHGSSECRRRSDSPRAAYHFEKHFRYNSTFVDMYAV